MGEEASEQFDLSRNIFLVALDVTGEVLYGACGLGGSNGPEGGMALLPASGKAPLAEHGWSCFTTAVAAHELGHAFGLAHDHFRSTTRSPSSYHTDWIVTSVHAAKWLDAHRYFNIGRTYADSDEQTTVEMLPPLSVPPHAIRLRFELSDPDGLHQAQLHNASGEAIGSQGVEGPDATVEFVTTDVAEAPANGVSLRVVDVHGNVTCQEHPIDITMLLPQESVSIPNANLGSLVRESLGLGSDDGVTQLDMLRLMGFEATGLEIAVIAGLESTVSLKELFLSDNQIEDLSPIAGSTILEALDLNQNNVSDISSLADMTNLSSLGLSGNAVSDLSPLAELAVLNSLELRANAVSDISSLAGLANPAFLDLSGDSVTDLSPLAGLTRLRCLGLWHSPVSDISPLARLNALTHLHVVGGSVDDLSALAGLTRLEELNISENSISNLSPLAGMTHLSNLCLASHSVTDISPLTGLTSLRELDLSGNPLSDHSIDAHIPALRSRGVTVLFEDPR